MVGFLGRGAEAAVLHPPFAFLPSSPTKFLICLLFSPLVSAAVFHLHVERPRYETTVPSPQLTTEQI